MTERYDAIVIGGGHNGLTCAAYLARAGRNVLIAEAAAEPGGAAITREFAPGFKVSACAHLLYGLDREIAGDLELSRHGLEYVAQGLATISFAKEGEHLRLDMAGASGAGVTEADREALREFRRRYGRFAELLAGIYRQRPPRLAPGDTGELFAAARLGLAMRRMGRADMREFLRVAAINVYDILEESFQNELLKGALAMDAVLGTHLGPRSNNSVLNLLHRYAGGAAPRTGQCDLPRGGMGSVTRALAAAAAAGGAQLRTGTAVERILLDDTQRVCGVQLAGGETVSAPLVVSSADPHTTFFGLVGADRLETGFARRIHHLRMKGNAAKLHLALDGLPDFRGLGEDDLRQRLLMAGTPAEIEQAFDYAKYGRCSATPIAEFIIPTLSDPALAPAGKHVLSAVVQYAPCEHRDGWDNARKPFLDTIIARLAQWAPDLPDRITASELLAPPDIEREFRIHGGHWHHGELAFDQFLMLRPVPGASRYAAPVEGLYLCGAGSHPGGGIMGTAGRNAAREIIARKEAA